MDLGQQLNLFFNFIDDSIIVIDQSQKIKFQNKQSIALFKSDFTNQHITNLIRAPQFLDTLEKSINEKIPYTLELLIDPASQDISQTNIFLSVSIYPSKDMYLIVMKNITDVKNLEIVRSSFIANVSHEMRTPLASIIGFLETISSSAKDDIEATKKFLSIIEKEALRMKRLLDDLLIITKIESDEHVHPTKKVDLLNTLEIVENNFEQSLKKNNISIEKVYDDENLYVLGNQDELIQVFSNIIENSIKYANENSKIRIKLRILEDKNNDHSVNRLFQYNYAIIELIDESEGIPKKHLHRLTERFYRVDKARSKDKGGTGLGLTIVKHILNKHRGSLDIESEINKGSIFTIKIPVAPIT